MSAIILKHTFSETTSADGTVLSTDLIADPIVEPLPGPGESIMVAFLAEEQWWSNRKGREIVQFNLQQMDEYLRAVGLSLEEASITATHISEQQMIYVCAEGKVPAKAD
jgi:hypothetical protein